MMLSVYSDERCDWWAVWWTVWRESVVFEINYGCLSKLLTGRVLCLSLKVCFLSTIISILRICSKQDLAEIDMPYYDHIQGMFQSILWKKMCPPPPMEVETFHVDWNRLNKGMIELRIPPSLWRVNYIMIDSFSSWHLCCVSSISNDLSLMYNFKQ